MSRLLKLILPLLAIFTLLGAAAPAMAAKYGIQDDAKFFSAETVTQGEQIIKQIRAGDDRDVLVITYDKLPDDVEAKLTDTNKGTVFQDWADSVFTDNGVSGVLILITRHPGHLVSAVGNKTKLHTFTGADKTDLEHKMLALLKEKKHDEALLAGLNFIKDRMTANENRAGGAQSGAAPPVYPTTPVPNGNSGGMRVGGLLCVGIGLLVIVFIIIGAANRNRGGYGGAPPQGGYPPTYGGGYPQGGYGGGYMGGGGGGGGFGRGLLGGLLGGALGAWGYEKFNQPNNPNSNYPPTPTGGGNFGGSVEQPDTAASGGSGGGDFDSSSSSSDFNSSDSGGGGSDFGGGGGGDFGGGGGDSGGGGGGGGGGDF